MGPLRWWWRLWSRVIDPELIRARDGIETQLARADAAHARADDLSSALADTRAEVVALTARLEQADAELTCMRARLSDAEGGAAELHARVDELLNAQAEADRLRLRLDELEASH